MSNGREHPPGALRIVETFLQLDEQELSSMSSAELQEELTCMGADIPKLKAQVIDLISRALDTNVDDGEALALTKLPDWFGMDMTLPTLGAQTSTYLSSTAALSETTNNRFELKEVHLKNFFSESLLSQKLTWAGSTIRIAKNVDDENENLARYIGYVDVKPDAKRHLHLLRIALGTVGGRRSEILLSLESPSGIFVGDLLPADWDLVHIELAIEPEFHDS